MPAFTTPDNIQYPIGGDSVVPLANVFKELADDTQDALNSLRGEIGDVVTDINNLELDDIADVNISAPTNNEVLSYNGSGWVNARPGSGFTARSMITATNASWPVPALAFPIVKVTVVGGGGGGGGGAGGGGNGTASTFNAGGAGTVTAAGGLGGVQGTVGDRVGRTANPGLCSGNGGSSGSRGFNPDGNGASGTGGAISVQYLNLTGVSTVNVTIGSGGTGAPDARGGVGGNGGRGEVIFEYVAV